jgi:hypothetical protein
MKAVNRNASASAFGWQFQINIAIYLMIKYFGKFKEMKIEGEKEDIEISLNNSKKIYAQAKSKQNINDGDTSSYSTKLRKALESLSDVNDNDSESLIYISNLEPNPLNSGTNEFELVSFFKYNELSLASKEKIDIQLNQLQKNINRDKLIIAKVPFFGEDKETKQKYIIAKIENFLTFISSDLLPYKNRFLQMLESEALHNATQNNMKLKFKKEDVLWRLLILKLGDGNSIKFDESMEIEEETFFEALDTYDRIINYKEADFDVYNKISNLIMKAKIENKEIRSNQFVIKYENEIYDIVFKNNKDSNMETIEKACSKIIAKKIFIRKGNIMQMFERANKYEN